MKSVFISLLPGQPYLPLLYPNLGFQQRDSILFLNNAFRHLTEPVVRIEEDPSKAEYLLIPHNFPTVRHDRAYLSRYADLSRRHGKKIIVFWHGDSSRPVRLPNAVVFRTSQYAFEERSNEITMPPYTEDLLENNALTLRSVSLAPPVIGFCGWVEYKNARNRIGTLLRNALVDTFALWTGKPELRAMRKGLSYRRAALSLLERSPLVRCNVIRRRSYSGHRSTIGMDPAQARREYVRNMLESDFSLVVKGDGNYSYRFYEALSLGRVPLLLDTACRLPLPNVIDYREFVVFVDFSQMRRLPAIAAEKFHALSNEQFQEMQRAAREAFDTYLRTDRFLKYAFEKLV